MPDALITGAELDSWAAAFFDSSERAVQALLAAGVVPESLPRVGPCAAHELRQCPRLHLGQRFLTKIGDSGTTLSIPEAHKLNTRPMAAAPIATSAGCSWTRSMPAHPERGTEVLQIAKATHARNPAARSRHVTSRPRAANAPAHDTIGARIIAATRKPVFGLLPGCVGVGSSAVTATPYRATTSAGIQVINLPMKAPRPPAVSSPESSA